MINNDSQKLISYKKKADQGDAHAQNYLGWMYENGRGVEKNYVQALDWYAKAANQGYADGQNNLGRMFSTGRGTAQNYLQAVAWYQKAADQGCDVAQFNLAWMYEDGRGVEKNDVQALAWYRKAADQGYPGAQSALGLMYEIGSGVDQDDKQAVAWYQLAAEQGYAIAQCNLGLMYEKGRGVKQNYEQAVAWYQKAADQGNDFAQFSLGLMYENGRGIGKNYEQAVAWYRKAADQGNANAQSNLGRAYALGQGIEKNNEQAVAWYQKAAEQGNAIAQNNLGCMCRDGQCVEQSDIQAVAWYQKAADQGHADAQCSLGWMYENARGIEKSLELAVAWYRKAADQGHVIGIKNLDLINRRRQEEKENGIKPRIEAYLPKVTVHPETLIHTTSRGDKVRSKSEVIIANLLYQAGIDYLYEADLSLLGYPKGILPDFLFIQDHKVVVWEHLGMADDPEYMNRWAKKLAWYRKNGFESGKTLFVTTEMAGLGLDVASLERIVRQVKHALQVRLINGGGVGKARTASAKDTNGLNETLVFIDFETSGLKPEEGCRTIEVGAVKVVNGQITDRFTSLMNPGVFLSREIVDITKITNEMVRNAPSSSLVIGQLFRFLDGLPIVAHNANFDERFLRFEFARERLTVPETILCSMKIARRVAPGLPSYSLSALSDYYNLLSNKNAHRALPDAEQAAALWQALEKSLLEKWGMARVSVRLMSKLQEIPVKNVPSFLRKWRED